LPPPRGGDGVGSRGGKGEGSLFLADIDFGGGLGGGEGEGVTLTRRRISLLSERRQLRLGDLDGRSALALFTPCCRTEVTPLRPLRPPHFLLRDRERCAKRPVCEGLVPLPSLCALPCCLRAALASAGNGDTEPDDDFLWPLFLVFRLSQDRLRGGAVM